MAFMKENTNCTFVVNSRQKLHSFLTFFLVFREIGQWYMNTKVVYFPIGTFCLLQKIVRGLLLNLREHNSSETTKKSVFHWKNWKLILLYFILYPWTKRNNLSFNKISQKLCYKAVQEITSLKHVCWGDHRIKFFWKKIDKDFPPSLIKELKTNTPKWQTTIISLKFSFS